MLLIELFLISIKLFFNCAFKDGDRYEGNLIEYWNWVWFFMLRPGNDTVVTQNVSSHVTEACKTFQWNFKTKEINF